ncbi:MAG: hypothetical protein Q8P54_01195 [bacterium]|nr:hypothetical protein [bacterium]
MSEIPSSHRPEQEVNQSEQTLDSLLSEGRPFAPGAEADRGSLDQNVFEAMARLVQGHREAITNFLEDIEEKKREVEKKEEAKPKNSLEGIEEVEIIGTYHIPDNPDNPVASVFNLEISSTREISLLIEPKGIKPDDKGDRPYKARFGDEEFKRLDETFSYEFGGRRNNLKIVRNGFNTETESPSGEKFAADDLDREIVIGIIGIISQQEEQEQRASNG